MLSLSPNKNCMKKLLLNLTLVFAFIYTQAQTTDNLKMVDSSASFVTIRGAIVKGSLIKTNSFNFYEINDKINQKPGTAQPSIVVYKDGKKYKMKIEGIDRLIACNKLQEVIESNIDGDFKGWNGNTTFKLMNRQDWIQDLPTSPIFVNLFRPAVTIYLTSEGYKMKIEGVNEDPILVKRL
jgi:hypothetical protein